MYKQVKFRPLGEEAILYGIWNTKAKEVICGCCGGVYNHEEIELIKVYNDWIDISNVIAGD